MFGVVRCLLKSVGFEHIDVDIFPFFNMTRTSRKFTSSVDWLAVNLIVEPIFCSSLKFCAKSRNSFRVAWYSFQTKKMSLGFNITSEENSRN